MTQENILPAGGQAVIEGVLMRSPNYIALALRHPNKKIVVSTQKVRQLGKIKVLNWPFIRGIANLFQMMYIGTKALNHSANVALDEEDESLHWSYVVGSIVLALVFGIFMFKFLPLLIAQGATYLVPKIGEVGILFNAIDGISKIAIFVIYLMIIGYMPDIKRVFQYHGAEHMAVNCYEAKKRLTVKNVKGFTTRHPRCGTSFIVIVLFLSVLVYTVIPMQYSFFLKLLVRIALLPVIAGISYELLKLSAKFNHHKIVQFLITPGLWVQGLTTRVPDNKQLEVSIKALKTALKAEGIKSKLVL